MTKIDRIAMPEQEPNIRNKDFREVPLGYSLEQAQQEASRCIQCKKAGCVNGCPVGVDIPKFIAKIVDGDLKAAIRVLWEKNSMPAICGRVCPQENQCEGNCILAKKGQAVSIGALERFVADRQRESGTTMLPEKSPNTNKKIACVGSGPASLTVAGDLIVKGHEVTVFEAFHELGGVLIYGIPEFRLPKAIVNSEISTLKKLGVKFVTNYVIGRILSIDDLLEEFDAVFIAIGAGLPKFLNIKGENLIGVCSANEYLTRANLMRSYKFPEADTPIIKGNNVLVLGGGNVAMDAARTAVRLGAKSVNIVYRRTLDEMPARAEEVHHAKEEGVGFKILSSPIAFVGNDKGQVISLTCQQMELASPDESGRYKPIAIPNNFFDLPCDLAIIAIGAGANPLLTGETPKIKVNKWGYIIANEHTGKTSKRAVWAGGDIVTGAATIILAAGAGRVASNSIHDYLTNGW